MAIVSALIYQLFISSGLLSLGIYHLICITRNYLSKSPNHYSAKPYHHFPPPPPSSSNTNYRTSSHLLRHLQLYLIIFSLLICVLHNLVLSTTSDPLLHGRTPVHRLTSLHSAAILFSFLLLTLSLLLSDTTSLLPLPSDLFFALSSALFFLHYSLSSSSASLQTSDLQAECDLIAARISALSSALCLILACNSKLYIIDALLGASFSLQGLWALQTGLSLYVDAFIPEGCHKLLDVVSGVEGSTKCDLEDTKLRAIAILDLVFVLHVLFLLVMFLVIYATIARSLGIHSRFGSYEVLPNAAAAADANHIQLKALTGTQA